jgi:hypothetical protein
LSVAIAAFTAGSVKGSVTVTASTPAAALIAATTFGSVPTLRRHGRAELAVDVVLQLAVGRRGKAVIGEREREPRIRSDRLRIEDPDREHGVHKQLEKKIHGFPFFEG